MQSSIHRLLVVIALLLGCITIGVFSARAFSQGAAAKSLEVGRYQMVRQSDEMVWLVDTKTGHCWQERYGSWSGQDPTKSPDQQEYHPGPPANGVGGTYVGPPH